MLTDKSNIIANLQREILPLQGLKKSTGPALDIGWGIIDHAFPNNCFPLGAIHEFISGGPEDQAATAGFISAILSAIMKNDGAALWISKSGTIFPPALKLFGIQPHHILFVDLQREKDVIWAMEESLKCNGLSAVIGEIPDLTFTASRRLQLAVEQSAVTGFLLRHQPRQLNTTASISRWKITSLPGQQVDGLPGVGFPNWNVELLRIRNGKPGSWQMGWEAGKFRAQTGMVTSITRDEKKKVV